MMKKVLTIVFLLLIPILSHALDEQRKRTFMRQLEFAIIKNPEYMWGGVSLDEGADCSGILFAIAKNSGLPVLRTTAYQMARGRDGWKSIVMDLEYRETEDGEAEDTYGEGGDLIWWTFSPDRPDGHVGVRYDKRVFAHASSKYGFIKAKLKSPLGKAIRKARRLTFDDKEKKP
jgi:hypothetical protein